MAKKVCELLLKIMLSWEQLPQRRPGELENRNSALRSRKNFISGPGKAARNSHCPWFLFQMPVLLEGGFFFLSVFWYVCILIVFSILNEFQMFPSLILGYFRTEIHTRKEQILFLTFYSMIATDDFWIVNYALLKPCAPSCLYLPQAIVTWWHPGGWVDMVVPVFFLIFLCTDEHLSYEMTPEFRQNSGIVLQTSTVMFAPLISVVTSKSCSDT